MSELGTTPPVTGAATPPGNEIKEKILAYERIVKLNSIVRVAFPLLVFSVIAVGIFSTWLTVSSAYNDKVVTEQTVKAGEELLPVLNKALRSFVDEVAPQLVEEFQTKLAASSERAAETLAMEIDRISKESMPFVEAQAKAAILARKEEHKALLAELYPELKNDPAKLEATATKLNKAFEFWTVKYMTHTLEDYFLAMARINDTVVKHYRPKPGDIDPNKPKVAEGEMLELFMELLKSYHGANMLRMKGIVKVSDDPSRPVVLHGVQHVFHPPMRLPAWPDKDERTRLVFIVKDIEKPMIEGLFRAFTDQITGGAEAFTDKTLSLNR